VKFSSQKKNGGIFMRKNEIVIEGNLMQDPELSETNSGLAMCRFSLENNFVLNEEYDVANVVTWSRTAENCGEYLQENSHVRVRGRIDDSYTKKGLHEVDVVAQWVDFISL